jgi:cycloartenol synthase
MLQAGGEWKTQAVKAARLLVGSQLVTGDWRQQSISGVFNKNCMISYR